MLLELVLVAAVLALAGLAVYQSNHRSTVSDTASQAAPAPVTTESLANSAAAIGTADSASDAATSASADAMADQLTASENDVTNLGGSSNDSF
jgi:hypothetical protein